MKEKIIRYSPKILLIGFSLCILLLFLLELNLIKEYLTMLDILWFIFPFTFSVSMVYSITLGMHSDYINLKKYVFNYFKFGIFFGPVSLVLMRLEMTDFGLEELIFFIFSPYLLVLMLILCSFLSKTRKYGKFIKIVFTIFLGFFILVGAFFYILLFFLANPRMH